MLKLVTYYSLVFLVLLVRTSHSQTIITTSNSQTMHSPTIYTRNTSPFILLIVGIQSNAATYPCALCEWTKGSDAKAKLRDLLGIK